MKKIVNYIGILSLALFSFASCEKNEIEYDAKTLTDEAEFEIHYMVPVASPDVYRIDINDKDVTNGVGTSVPFKNYESLPGKNVSTGHTATAFPVLGLYYTAPAGAVSVKFYNAKDELMYSTNINLKSGKQNVVVYDFAKDPMVFDAEYPYNVDRKSYQTDTIGYVKFYNLMYDAVGTPSTLKLQYQYQKHWVHPIYTYYDVMNGTAPEGIKLADLASNISTGTKDGVDKGPWMDLGTPVAYGETTGWQPVPINRATYINPGSARIDYRAIVVEGGVAGVNMDATTHELLTKQNTAGAFSDYWTAYTGCRQHQFFVGVHPSGLGSAIKVFWAQ